MICCKRTTVPTILNRNDSVWLVELTVTRKRHKLLSGYCSQEHIIVSLQNIFKTLIIQHYDDETDSTGKGIYSALFLANSK